MRSDPAAFWAVSGNEWLIICATWREIYINLKYPQKKFIDKNILGLILCA